MRLPYNKCYFDCFWPKKNKKKLLPEGSPVNVVTDSQQSLQHSSQLFALLYFIWSSDDRCYILIWRLDQLCLLGRGGGGGHTGLNSSIISWNFILKANDFSLSAREGMFFTSKKNCSALPNCSWFPWNSVTRSISSLVGTHSTSLLGISPYRKFSSSSMMASRICA